MQKSFEQKDRFQPKETLLLMVRLSPGCHPGLHVEDRQFCNSLLKTFWMRCHHVLWEMEPAWKEGPFKDEEQKKDDSYNELFLLFFLFCSFRDFFFNMQWFFIRQTLNILYNYLLKMTWGRGKKGSSLLRFITSLGVRAAWRFSVVSPEPSTGMDI